MLFSLLFSIVFFNFSSPDETSISNEEITIVVVEGKAFLADVDAAGRIVHKYMEIEGYIDTGKVFDKQVEKAKEDYLRISEREKDQIRFIQYDYLNGAVTGLAIGHLSDLTKHYNNSYANQIIITLSKRSGNELFLKEKEELLVEALLKLKVPDEDIEVRYKWDRGDEPTQFVKVNTDLRQLTRV